MPAQQTSASTRSAWRSDLIGQRRRPGHRREVGREEPVRSRIPGPSSGWRRAPREDRPVRAPVAAHASTRKPSAARRTATARPIPSVAPVTTATRPMPVLSDAGTGPSSSTPCRSATARTSAMLGGVPGDSAAIATTARVNPSMTAAGEWTTNATASSSPSLRMVCARTPAEPDDVAGSSDDATDRSVRFAHVEGEFAAGHPVDLGRRRGGASPEARHPEASGSRRRRWLRRSVRRWRER